MNKELWKLAPGLKGLYEISSTGRFRRTGTSRLRSLVADKNGYYTCVAYLGEIGDIKCVKMHRLVAGAFIGKIADGMQVNHKNGKKNDNRVENLEIVTPAQNTQHTFDALGRKGRNSNPTKGESHPMSRWKEADISEMRRLYSSGITQVEIAKRFQTSQGSVSRIILKKGWKHVA